MRVTLLLVTTIACSAERGIVYAPVVSGAPAAKQVLAPLEPLPSWDLDPRLGNAPNVSGTAWDVCSPIPQPGLYATGGARDVCSPLPHPGRFAFLPNGNVSLEGNFVASRARLGHWTWSQKGDRVTFGNAYMTIKVYLKDDDSMTGSGYVTATPKQTSSVSLQRVTQP